MIDEFAAFLMSIFYEKLELITQKSYLSYL